EQRVQAGTKAPRPPALALVGVARLIDVEARLQRQFIQQLLIGLIQRSAHLVDDLGQLTPREGHADDVAEKLADGGVGGMSCPFEVRNQGRQAWPDESADLDPGWQRGVM